MGGCCNPMCKGIKMVVLGAIIVANEYYLKFNWWYLFGGLIALKGLMIALFHGKCACENKKPKKKK